MKDQRINKKYLNIFSRQNSNEENLPSSSMCQSMDNIFLNLKPGKEYKKAASQKTASQNFNHFVNRSFPSQGGFNKGKVTQSIKSVFGGSCGNIFEKTVRRNSGFEHPLSLHLPQYNNTIIGLESLNIRPSGFVSPGSIPGGVIGLDYPHSYPDDELEPIRDDDGFDDVAGEGNSEDIDEEDNTEEEYAMDFASESLTSSGSELDEYRYTKSARGRSGFKSNPLYISDSSSSYSSSLGVVKENNRRRRIKKQQPKSLLGMAAAMSSRRRSSGTDSEQINSANQRQKQFQFKNFGKVINLPPKWSNAERSSEPKQSATKNKHRKKKMDIYETLNEELTYFKNEKFRRSFERGRPEGEDRFGNRIKSSSTVPHSRTGSPCSVNSLHLTTRSNTPTQFQMHFNPINPAWQINTGSLAQPRKFIQKVTPTGLNFNTGSGGVAGAGITGMNSGGLMNQKSVVGGMSSSSLQLSGFVSMAATTTAKSLASFGLGAGGGNAIVKSNQPEQKLSVRITNQSNFTFLLLILKLYWPEKTKHDDTDTRIRHHLHLLFSI